MGKALLSYEIIYSTQFALKTPTHVWHVDNKGCKLDEKIILIDIIQTLEIMFYEISNA